MYLNLPIVLLRARGYLKALQEDLLKPIGLHFKVDQTVAHLNFIRIKVALLLLKEQELVCSLG